MFPEQIQNSGMLRTRGKWENLSIYHVKLQHIKTPDAFKIWVFWKPEAYFEYHESLDNSLHRTLCNLAISELEAY